MNTEHKAGFVNIFGAPNAGKSTLMNALLGEHLVITSPKVQTTRHRILGILSESDYQIIFSDTPGIIDPKYKLHNKMMKQVSSALEDADLGIIVHDIEKPLENLQEIAQYLNLKVPVLLVLNKIDLLKPEAFESTSEQYKNAFPNWDILCISAEKNTGIEALKNKIIAALPIAPPYYPEDSMSDRPMRFFVSEIIRGEIYQLYHEEIPYHAAVLIQAFEEKSTLTVIKADIIVSRETQKMILLGKGGSSIKKLGIASRLKIETFIGQKVHLELFIKVRPKWRDNENYLKEYGYHN